MSIFYILFISYKNLIFYLSSICSKSYFLYCHFLYVVFFCIIVYKNNDLGNFFLTLSSRLPKFFFWLRHCATLSHFFAMRKTFYILLLSFFHFVDFQIVIFYILPFSIFFKDHSWVTDGGRIILPATENHCSIIEVTDEEVKNSVKIISKLSSLVRH